MAIPFPRLALAVAMALLPGPGLRGGRLHDLDDRSRRLARARHQR
jgi:hypothetical protein